MPRKLVVIIVIIISLYIIFSLTKQIFNALDAGKRLDNKAGEVNKLQEQNRNLKSTLGHTLDPDYIEQIARDKLNLTKPGETVVVISDDEIKRLILSARSIPKVEVSNWQGWLLLFTR